MLHNKTYCFKNVKLQLVSWMMLWTSSLLLAQSDSAFYKNDVFNCKYHLTAGMLNGHYVSYYNNGVKKSEGNFQYNTRIGEWSVWDSTGKLRTKRMYTNPYDYKRVYPETSTEGPVPLLSSPIYKLHRDSSGAWKRFQLEYIMLKYKQRDFKWFYTSQTQLFFDYNSLYTILCEAVMKNNVSVYGRGGKDEDYVDEKLDIASIDTSKVKLVGFRIKSDWHFDDKRLEGDPRVLWITVLVTNKNDSKDTTDLFTVYYPNLQKMFVREKILNTMASPYIQNLDDVFFFSSFGFEKYSKKLRIDSRLQYTYTPGNKVSNGLLDEVETEHNLWIYFNK
jgi:hypothetical protein